MPALLEVLVQKEFVKDPKLKTKDIQSIRDWLKQQPHLPEDFITDFDIILAYHSCKGCIDQTKEVIDLNFTLRTLFAFYQNRHPDRILKAALSTWLITPLSTMTKRGYSVIYCQLLDADPNKFVYGDVVKAFVMMMDLWQCEEGTVPGVAVVVDMAGVTLGHLSRIDLAVAQQFFYFLQEAMFVRLKEFHFINAPSFVDSFISMVKPFMKQDLLEMLKVHTEGSNSLEVYIPKDAFPKDLKEGMVLRDEVWDKIKTNEGFFEEELKKRVNESKRPGGPKTMSSFFSGLEASFKKLEID